MSAFEPGERVSRWLRGEGALDGLVYGVFARGPGEIRSEFSILSPEFPVPGISARLVYFALVLK